jgi:transmembrane sensor
MRRVVDIREPNAIEAEASAWIVQLDGKPPSKEDIAALREWMSRSPRHLEAIRRLAGLWGQLDVLTELVEERAGAARAAAPRRRPAFAVGRWRLATAAVALFAVAAALVAVLGSPPREAAERSLHATAIGELKHIVLSDGSTVDINTDSIVEIDFGADERHVRLVRGEALFEVAHNPVRPFVVYAGRSAVRAVGTAFSVRIKAEELEIRVTEGRVELVPDVAATAASSPGEPAPVFPTIGASQTVILANDVPRIETLDEAVLDRMLSWRDGMLAFEGEPLSQVVEEVSRYTPTRIEIQDPELRDLRIGGYFRVGETDALLEALETGFGVAITREGSDLVRLARAEPG